jgi:hypothetical protein
MPINEHYLLMRKKTVLLNALGVPLCTIVMYLNTSIFGTVSVPSITVVPISSTLLHLCLVQRKTSSDGGCNEGVDEGCRSIIKHLPLGGDNPANNFFPSMNGSTTQCLSLKL